MQYFSYFTQTGKGLLELKSEKDRNRIQKTFPLPNIRVTKSHCIFHNDFLYDSLFVFHHIILKTKMLLLHCFRWAFSISPLITHIHIIWYRVFFVVGSYGGAVMLYIKLIYRRHTHYKNSMYNLNHVIPTLKKKKRKKNVQSGYILLLI